MPGKFEFFDGFLSSFYSKGPKAQTALNTSKHWLCKSHGLHTSFIERCGPCGLCCKERGSCLEPLELPHDILRTQVNHIDAPRILASHSNPISLQCTHPVQLGNLLNQVLFRASKLCSNVLSLKPKCAAICCAMLSLFNHHVVTSKLTKLSLRALERMILQIIYSCEIITLFGHAPIQFDDTSHRCAANQGLQCLQLLVDGVEHGINLQMHPNPTQTHIIFLYYFRCSSHPFTFSICTLLIHSHMWVMVSYDGLVIWYHTAEAKTLCIFESN